MAVLTQPVSLNNPFAEEVGNDLPPVGTFIATVLKIKDQFGVKRLKFQSTEMETVDLTCFLFGFRDLQNQPRMVASKQMKISANEKSNLFGFLQSMLGRAPSMGWDYCELKGHKCLVTITHVQKRDGSGSFPSITSVSPIPQGFTPGATQQPAAAPAQPAATQQTAEAAPAPVPTTPPEEDEVPF